MAAPRLNFLLFSCLFLEAEILQNKQEESKSWQIATATMLVIAAVVFLIQRFAGPVLDIIFEICVFDIPAVVMVILFLYFRHKN